jgi:hypothetical protein
VRIALPVISEVTTALFPTLVLPLVEESTNGKKSFEGMSSVV